MKATLIKTDGTITNVKPANDKHFTLEEMQAFVGGFIEFVYLKDKVIVLDEEGRLKGKEPNYFLNLYTNISIVGDVLVTDVGWLE